MTSRFEFGNAAVGTRAIANAGGSLTINGLGVAVFAEKAVTFPGLDPTDRSARTSNGGTSFYGPGRDVGTTLEWRQCLNTDINVRDTATCSTSRNWGWNYSSAGSQINSAFGSIGGAEEGSYLPPSPSTDTWSELHLRFTPPSTAPGPGVERRVFTFTGSWVLGTTAAQLSAYSGSINFVSADGGTSSPMLGWSGSDALTVRGSGFLYMTNASIFNRQVNGAGDGFVSLPYIDALNRCDIGLNMLTGARVDAVLRGAVIQHRTQAGVVTPASGYTTLFYDSADGVLKQKDSTGTVTNV